MDTQTIDVIKQNLIKLLDASRSEGFYQGRILDTNLSDRTLMTYGSLRYIANQDRNDALITIEKALEIEREKA